MILLWCSNQGVLRDRIMRICYEIKDDPTIIFPIELLYSNNVKESFSRWIMLVRLSLLTVTKKDFKMPIRQML